MYGYTIIVMEISRIQNLPGKQARIGVKTEHIRIYSAKLPNDGPTLLSLSLDLALLFYSLCFVCLNSRS